MYSTTCFCLNETYSKGNWCNKLHISFWQYRWNSEFPVFLTFELRFIILFWDICLSTPPLICVYSVLLNAVEFKEMSLPFGRGSRVTSRGSRVNGRVSKNYSKLFLYFVNSKVEKLVFTRVSGACFCRIWVIFWFVKNFYIPTDSPACWASESGPLYFCG